MNKNTLYYLGFMVAVVGCKSTELEQEPNLEDSHYFSAREISYVSLNEPKLEPVSTDTLEQSLKNGIFMKALGRLDNPTLLEFSMEGAEGMPITWLPNIPAGHKISQRAQLYPPYWFVANSDVNSSSNIDIEPRPPGFQVVKLDDSNHQIELVNEVLLNEQYGALDSLYLAERNDQTPFIITLRNRVVDRYQSSKLFSEQGVMYQGEKIEPTRNDYYFHSAPDSKIELTFTDISVPELSQVGETIVIDGEAISSRKIGNTLYIAAYNEPWVDDLFSIKGVSQRGINEAKLAAVELQELSAFYRKNGETQPLWNNCLGPVNASMNSTAQRVFNLLAIDLESATLTGNVCLLGVMPSSSYFSDDAFYMTTGLSGQETPESAIFKIDLQPNTNPILASGRVPFSAGRLGLANTQISTWGDQVHVFSASYIGSRYRHQLSILKQDAERLEMDKSFPQASWGISGNLFEYGVGSISFVDEHLVISGSSLSDKTFYKSLSAPSDDAFFELLGADYAIRRVQLIEKDLILLMGEKLRNSPNGGGIWVGVYHTQDANPVLLDNLYLGSEGTTGYVRRPEEVSFFRDGESLKMSFILNLVENDSWRYTGLQLIELQGLPNIESHAIEKADYSSVRLVNAGAIKTEAQGHDRYFSGNAFNNRSLINGEDVYLYRHNAFWSGIWGTEDEPAQGPLTKELSVCAQAKMPSVIVDIVLPAAKTHQACSASVTVDSVYYTYTLLPEEDQLDPQRCRFSGPPGEMGGLKITAKLEGFKQAGTSVNVHRGICDSKTEHVTIEMSENTVAM